MDEARRRRWYADGCDRSEHDESALHSVQNRRAAERRAADARTDCPRRPWWRR